MKKKKRMLIASLILVPILLAVVLCASSTHIQIGDDPDRESVGAQLNEPILIQNEIDTAIVEFTDFMGYEEAEASYRWRFLDSFTGTEESCQGRVFRKYIEIPLPGSNLRIDIGSQTTIKAGPFNLQWSYASPHSGWVSYQSDVVSVVEMENEDFDTYDLSKAPQPTE